jgi:hypothetical protein
MHFALVDGVHLMLKIDEWGEMPKQSEPHTPRLVLKALLL